MTKKDRARPPGDEPVVATSAEEREKKRKQLLLPGSEADWRKRWRKKSQWRARIGGLAEVALLLLVAKGVPKHAAEDLSQDIAERVYRKKRPKDFEKEGVAKAPKNLRNYLSRTCRREALKFWREGLPGETKNHRIVQFASEDEFPAGNFFSDFDFKRWELTQKNLKEYSDEELEIAMAQLTEEERLIVENASMGYMTKRAVHQQWFLATYTANQFYTFVTKTADHFRQLLESQRRGSE